MLRQSSRRTIALLIGTPEGTHRPLLPPMRPLERRDYLGRRAGDVGVIVEHHPARAHVAEGYELEVFAATCQTIAVVSVPASAIRANPARPGLLTPVEPCRQ